MLHNLKRYWRLYKVLIKQFLKVVMQSKLDFFMGLMGFFLTQASGIIFLYLIFQQIPTLQGWTLEQLIFIYGFAQIPRGIDHLLTDNLWLVAWHMVISGQFDRYMLRPMNVFFQVIAEKLQPDALGEILIGTILVILSVQKGVAVITPLNALLFLVSMLAGALIYTSIKLFFSSFSLWIKQSGPLLNVAYEMSEFAKYPTEIYHKGIRFIITWVIPFAFVAYLPASFFLGKGGAGVIGIECIIAAVFWCVAYGVFNYGLKFYESAGN